MTLFWTNEIAAIDAEGFPLQQVRELLCADGSASSGSGKKQTSERTLNAEDRAKIAAAQKKRWTAAKKSAK
jgi:hypothetical protein